jgi:hypothetical protein
MYVFPNEIFYSYIEISFGENFCNERTAPISDVNYEVTEQKLIFHTKL